MKKYISVALACLLAISCDTKFLDTSPTTAISTSTMWTTEDLAEAGMAGIYRALYKSDLSRTQIRMEDYDGLNRTGIEGTGFTSMIDQTNYPLRYLARAQKIASSFQLRLEWTTLYTVVHACNDAIANLQVDPIGEDKYERFQCEARLLRAFIYSRLNMLYGGVPVYLEPVTNEECTKTQSSFTEVWQVVIDDCTYAIENENCPDNTLTSNYGRPSKGMAYSLRGMAYMWLAANLGPKAAFSGETVDPISDDEVLEYYSLAASDFEAVAGCGYGLWTGEWGDLFCVDNETSSEIIFPLQFNSTSGYSTNWQKVIGGDDNYIGWQNIMPSADWVDTIQWSDGSEFDWTQIFEDWDELSVTQREVLFCRDSLDDVEDRIAYYNELLASTTDADEMADINVAKNYYSTLQTNRDNVISRVGEETYEKYYLNYGNEARVRSAYDDRDPRLEQLAITPYERVSCFDPRYNTSVVYKQNRWPLKGMNKYDDDGDYWGCNRATFFYIWKKYNVLDDSLSEYGSDARERGDCDWPLIRYTQIYLELAEAYVHLGEYAKAKTIVDEIRARAGMPSITLGTEEEMLEAIRYETRIELCQEGVNFFDEIRWGTYYETKFQGADVNGGKSIWGDTQYSYNWYYVETMWPWSISDRAAEKNANLKRRDGWTY